MKTKIVIILAIFFLMVVPTAVITVKAQKTLTNTEKTRLYVCPMHPEVTSKRQGKCSKCGMKLTVQNTKAELNSPQPPANLSSGGGVDNTEKAISVQHIPDTLVFDQNGRKLRFYSDLVKGKVVAINFIFTTCTTICPPLTATFRKVQQDLSKQSGRNVELISISVDPTTDVPERLKGFAEKFHAAEGWTFVTGDKQEIDGLLRALGALADDKSKHTPMILIGNDSASYWTRTYGLAPASNLVAMINDAASRKNAVAAQNGSSAENSNAVQVPLSNTSASSPSNMPSERQVERKPAVTVASDSPNGSSKTLSEASASYFTNLELVTQDNRSVRFYDDLLKDKIVLIDFIFTTCKAACSPMTANLAKVQRYLGDRVGKDVVMITISVDPETDTPEVLKKYAEEFKAKPGWYFLTGKKENVDWVLYKLGGYVEDKSTHSTALLIGNVASGQWVRLLALTPASEIVGVVTKVTSGSEQ